MADPVSVICIGGAAIDRKYRAARKIRLATSNPVRGITSFGGVARNVSENLANLGVRCLLVSAVGDDQDGRELIGHLRSVGVDCDLVVTGPGATAAYIAAINPDGSLVVAMSDMGILDHLTPDRLDGLAVPVDQADWLFADCNLPQDTLQRIIDMATDSRCRVAIDAVSVAKSSRLPANLAGTDLLFVNQDEALAIVRNAKLTPEEAAARLRDRGAENVIVTLGAEGCICSSSAGTDRIPAKEVGIIDATGAGDALIAGTLAGLAGGKSLKDALIAGTALAAKALASTESVPPI